MKEELIKIDQIGINVKYSIDDKPVILFLHFSGGNLNMWDGILPQFEKEYSIIAPDCRGHGKSDKPLTGYHIDDMANDLYLLLMKLEVKKCHIIGSSMGAEVGLSLAATHPELVISLVCEGAIYNEFGEYGIFDGSENEIEQKKETMKDELAEREERVYRTVSEYVEEQKVELEQEGIWNEYFASFFEHNLQKMENEGYAYCYLNRVRTEYIQKYWDLKFEDYYKKVKCPVLFLPSEEESMDETITKSLAYFADIIDNYEIINLKNSIHAYVWMQLPTLAGKTVKEFISKIKDRRNP